MAGQIRLLSQVGLQAPHLGHPVDGSRIWTELAGQAVGQSGQGSRVAN
jgi:hypothetical protein